MIIQKDTEGNILGRFNSVAEASEHTEIIATNIYAVLRGDRDKAGGSFWEKVQDEEPEQETQGNNLVEFSETADGAVYSGVLRGIKITSLQELLAYCKVDLDKWEVKAHTIRTWTTSMKKKSYIDSATALPPKQGAGFVGKPLPMQETDQLLNIGFKVELIANRKFLDNLKQTLLSNIQPLPKKAAIRKNNGRYVAEFMITDHHLGKAGFDPSTLKFNWSIEQAIQEYYNVIDFGIDRLDTANLTEILLIAGNDYLHIDSNLGTTSSGTKVADSQFFLTLFRYGKETLINSILKLREIAPVRVIFIPGNHDEVGTVTMSEVITEAFRNDPSVTVQCNGSGRDYYRFGVNFLAWQHGKGNNPQKAANMMIAERPQEFATAKFRFCHVGHTHMSKKTEVKTFNTLSEDHGVVYEICPSVTSTDFWHFENIFIGPLRRSKIFVYDIDHGLTAEHYYNII